MRKALQVIETARDEYDADLMADALMEQEGLIGLRVLRPSGCDLRWRVQAFFEDDGPDGDGWLPDGCRRVFLHDSLLRGLRQPEIMTRGGFLPVSETEVR